MTVAETAAPTSRGRVRTELCHKRVRAYLDGHLVVDSISPTLVWESPHYPTYYFPRDDIRGDLILTGTVEHSPSRGDAQMFDVKVGNSRAEGAARVYPQSPLEAISGLVRFDWNAMTEWLEEDEVVYTHARDPYTRVDALPSSRHVVLEVDGVIVADSHRPVLLFETGLPVRYYLPLADVRLDLLRPTATKTHCPYKGTATYWSLDTGTALHKDLVWIYRAPLPESQKIAGLACFYNEKVDIEVDGILEEGSRTHLR